MKYNMRRTQYKPLSWAADIALIALTLFLVALGIHLGAYSGGKALDYQCTKLDRKTQAHCLGLEDVKKLYPNPEQIVSTRKIKTVN